jgi:mono/diheme cytochrome c family protein
LSVSVRSEGCAGCHRASGCAEAKPPALTGADRDANDAAIADHETIMVLDFPP